MDGKEVIPFQRICQWGSFFFCDCERKRGGEVGGGRHVEILVCDHQVSRVIFLRHDKHGYCGLHCRGVNCYWLMLRCYGRVLGNDVL